MARRRHRSLSLGEVPREGKLEGSDAPGRLTHSSAPLAWLAKIPFRPSLSVSAAILVLAACLAPLPLGSTEPFVVAFWCLWLGLGVTIASPRHLTVQHGLVLTGLFVVLSGYAFVLHEQLSAQPWVASPDPIWAEASAALGKHLIATASINHLTPFYSIGPTLANGLALWLGVSVGADRRAAQHLHTAVAWSGLAYAIFGLIAATLDPTMVLWVPRLDHFGTVTATFMNKNTAAPYLGGVCVLWMLRLFEELHKMRAGRPFGWAILRQGLVGGSLRTLPIPFLCLACCLGALFMTASRGGVAASLLMFIVAYFLMFRRMMRRWSTRLIAFWGVVWVLGVVVELFGGAALARFDALGLDDEERFLVYGATLRMIRDHPWFGTGLGTFPWAFPAYRPPEMSIWGIWEQAHSTPLELFAELGIPLGLLVSFAWFSALAVLAYGSWVRRRDLTLPIGALCFAAIGLVQSSVDFSMQVPGYTIVLFALAGSGLAQSFSSRRRGSALA